MIDMVINNGFYNEYYTINHHTVKTRNYFSLAIIMSQVLSVHSTATEKLEPYFLDISEFPPKTNCWVGVVLSTCISSTQEAEKSESKANQGL